MNFNVKCLIYHPCFYLQYVIVMDVYLLLSQKVNKLCGIVRNFHN